MTDSIIPINSKATYSRCLLLPLQSVLVVLSGLSDQKSNFAKAMVAVILRMEVVVVEQAQAMETTL